MYRVPKLTPKQARFVSEYLVDLNATQAAIRAGYSRKTARAMGSENLTKPAIAAAIGRAQGAAERRAEIAADDVIERYRAIAWGELEGGVRVSDQLHALDSLARHLGMWAKDHAQAGKADVTITVREEPIEDRIRALVATREGTGDA